MNIQLPPEAEKERLAKKFARFQEGIKSLEAETGLKMIAMLDYQPHALGAKIQLVEEVVSEPEQNP